ncbi:petJ [Symbiodinium microadriaticum]|nr:petJ [Symbiodinium microadriaticum]
MGWVILNIVSKFLFIIMMQRYKMIHQRKIEAARELYGLSPSDDINEEDLKKQAITNGAASLKHRGVGNGGINAEAYGLGQGEEADSELKLVELVAETMGPFCSFHLSTKTMSRVAGIVFAASLALYGASCFIVPATLPKGAPQTESGAVVGQPSAINGTPESASWSPLAVGAALGLLIAVATGRPAFAADLENGEAIFNGNCTACHAGGNNSIVAEKKLKKEALVQYGKYDVQAIITQVTNGNGAMPAFGEKLGPDDIEDVANYVYSKADKLMVENGVTNTAVLERLTAERCMELNLPWALIDAAQRRWTAEKMNMGQDSGGNIEKEDPFKKLLEANKERMVGKNLASSLPGMYSGLNTPPVAGMGAMGMMDMAGMEEQMMSVMNKVMVPFQDMVMGRMQAMEENIQRQLEMTQEAISQRMDFSQVSLLQTVNACQVLLHKLDSSQETVMQKMDTQKSIVDRMVESYSGLVQNIDSASDNTKRSLLDTVNTSSAVMLQKLDTTQQDLLKQTHESHAVLQGVAQSQTSLAKKVDSGNEFTTRRLVEMETCLSKKVTETGDSISRSQTVSSEKMLESLRGDLSTLAQQGNAMVDATEKSASAQEERMSDVRRQNMMILDLLTQAQETMHTSAESLQSFTRSEIMRDSAANMEMQIRDVVLKQMNKMQVPDHSLQMICFVTVSVVVSEDVFEKRFRGHSFGHWQDFVEAAGEQNNPGGEARLKICSANPCAVVFILFAYAGTVFGYCFLTYKDPAQRVVTNLLSGLVPWNVSCACYLLALIFVDRKRQFWEPYPQTLEEWTEMQANRRTCLRWITEGRPSPITESAEELQLDIRVCLLLAVLPSLAISLHFTATFATGFTGVGTFFDVLALCLFVDVWRLVLHSSLLLAPVWTLTGRRPSDGMYSPREQASNDTRPLPGAVMLTFMLCLVWYSVLILMKHHEVGFVGLNDPIKIHVLACSTSYVFFPTCLALSLYYNETFFRKHLELPTEAATATWLLMVCISAAFMLLAATIFNATEPNSIGILGMVFSILYAAVRFTRNVPERIGMMTCATAVTFALVFASVHYAEAFLGEGDAGGSSFKDAVTNMVAKLEESAMRLESANSTNASTGKDQSEMTESIRQELAALAMALSQQQRESSQESLAQVSEALRVQLLPLQDTQSQVSGALDAKVAEIQNSMTENLIRVEMGIDKVLQTVEASGGKPSSGAEKKGSRAADRKENENIAVLTALAAANGAAPFETFL